MIVAAFLVVLFGALGLGAWIGRRQVIVYFADGERRTDQMLDGGWDR